MRHFILVLFALICLTQFTLAAKGGGDSGSSDSSSGSSSGSTGGGSSSSGGGGSSSQNATEESAATVMYAVPNTQTYLNLQNVLMAAGVMALAQHHFTGN
ncbi:hypothetical protein BDB00DRAFT_812177 [Zychaea mexicana]|uniref:uncharacterized protein n=1 Tax=Zychaea mexicana TaxID=64656 RepID=UPI0022FE9A00|nr:uncharacterized protein BDB00DRAFT_812177 [Zychaea mexicana]KAI9495848.1 hypothetical protein BDB00DRAFT_812177 [Zychaea mexicana]